MDGRAASEAVRAVVCSQRGSAPRWGRAGFHDTARRGPFPVAVLPTPTIGAGFPRLLSSPVVQRPTGAARPLRWGLGDFAWAWPATVVAQVVVGAVLVVARGTQAGHKADAIDVAAITVGSALATLGMLALLASARGRGSLRADFGFVVRIRDWPWLAAGAGLQVAGVAAVLVIQAISGSEPQQDVAKVLQRASTPARLAGGLAVVIAAPLAEELLFRGLLLRALLRRFDAGAAVLLSAAGFAAVHLLDVSAAPLLAPLLLVGVVAGIRAVRTGDLSQSIMLHAGFNLLSAAVLFAT